MDRYDYVRRALPWLARVNGNPPFQMRQSLPLQRRALVYSMQPNPPVAPKQRAWPGNRRANITTVSGRASSSVGTEGSLPRAPTGTQG